MHDDVYQLYCRNRLFCVTFRLLYVHHLVVFHPYAAVSLLIDFCHLSDRSITLVLNKKKREDHLHNLKSVPKTKTNTAQAGLGFSTIMLVVGAGLCTISGLYTLEVMARTQGVADAGENGKPEHRIGTQKFDFSVISEMFGGKLMQYITQIMVFMFGTPWSYAGVFASSMAALVFSYFSEEKCDVYHHPGSSCRMAYYILLAAFGMYGIGFAMLDVSEQVCNSITPFLFIYWLFLKEWRRQKQGINIYNSCAMRY